jgi:pentatricopeptide repeat protein
LALRTLREAIHANYALDSVCYTIVLHGLFRAHMVEEACGLFEQRKQSGIAPNTSTYYNVMFRGLCRTKDLHAVKQYITEMEHADVEMDSISSNAVAVLIKSPRVGSAAAIIGYMLNLGMKSSTKTCSLLAQSIG